MIKGFFSDEMSTQFRDLVEWNNLIKLLIQEDEFDIQILSNVIEVFRIAVLIKFPDFVMTGEFHFITSGNLIEMIRRSSNDVGYFHTPGTRYRNVKNIQDLKKNHVDLLSVQGMSSTIAYGCPNCSEQKGYYAYCYIKVIT